MCEVTRSVLSFSFELLRGPRGLVVIAGHDAPKHDYITPLLNAKPHIMHGFGDKLRLLAGPWERKAQKSLGQLEISWPDSKDSSAFSLQMTR